MMAYGSSAMLAGMASDGFVTAVVDTVNACDGMPKVRRFRITDAGRKAIERTMWRR
jgi:DNA-binding PadR family transcriptional regulator